MVRVPLPLWVTARLSANTTLPAAAPPIVKFPDAIRLATDNLRPHFLCLYLFELASAYSTFNNAGTLTKSAGTGRLGLIPSGSIAAPPSAR